MTRLVDLSHVVTAGMTTYPGLPGPAITPHLTREASRAHYTPGVEFAIDRISLVGNTGTYVDSPYHRYADGIDLADLPLHSVADLAVVVVRADPAERGIGPAAFTGPAFGGPAFSGPAFGSREGGGREGGGPPGTAVLLHTGWSRHFGTPAYGGPAPYLTAAGARHLVGAGVTLVGIDSVNIDDTHGVADRPAHSILLAAGVPVLEHLTNLAALPDVGARLHAVPPKVRAFGTFPVRAYAVLP